MGRDLRATICYGVIVEFGTDYFDYDDSLRIDPEPLDHVSVREWAEHRIKAERGIEIPDTPPRPSRPDFPNREAYDQALEEYRASEEYQAWSAARDELREARDSLGLGWCMSGNDADSVEVLYVDGSEQSAYWHATEIETDDFTMAREAEFDQAFHRGLCDLGIAEHPEPRWLLCPKWY